MNPRVRMVAGPNGSGKTTLLEYLRREFDIPFGFDLNPDKIEAELRATRRLPLLNWGVQFDDSAFRDAVSRHPLAKNVDSRHLSVRENVIEVRELPPMSYLAAIISDLLRCKWIDQSDSFVFETVMSSGDKIDLLTVAKARGYRELRSSLPIR